MPLRHFTNEEMLHILNHLSGAKDQLSAANGLFSGLEHWLYSSQKEYPKTGERPTLSLTILGARLFFVSGLILLKKRIRF